MTTIFNIDIWKKGTNRYSSMPDYQIEISEGEIAKLTELIDAIMKLADNFAKNEEEKEEKK